MNNSVYSSLSVEETIASLNGDPKNGLNEVEVSKRLHEFGKNELPKPKPYPMLFIFFRQFSSPLIWFLFLGSFIAGLLGEWVQMSAIIAIIFINSLIGFIQEFSAEKSFESLKRLYTPQSKTLRKGQIKKIPSSHLVPGDIVFLEAGDHIPADGRIIYESQLAVEESALTGESAPVYKETAPLEEKNIADQKNMAFFGTHVVKGKGKMIVTKTGLKTELGKIASSLQSKEKKLTPLQIRFNLLGKQLVFICSTFLLIIFVLGVWKKMGWVELALTSLSIAVAAIPEGLPAIVTISLAVGVKKLFKRKALIRRLASVETLGCTSVICTDKTGTITKNEIAVLHYWIGGEFYDVSGLGYEPKGQFKHRGSVIDPLKDPNLFLALKIGCLCNDAILAQIHETWEIIGDPTEGALLTAAGKAGLWKNQLENQAHSIGELPFDSDRKRMSVLRADGHLYVKGALESLLFCSTKCIWKGFEVELDQEKTKAIFDAHHHLTSQGYRVLALAQKKVLEKSPIEPTLEKNLILIGLVAMIDPPRPEVKEAIQTCRNAKIIPVMITGDHKETAKTIAKQIGLMDSNQYLALDGLELDKITDGELQKIILKTAVFARVTADHKLRIIQAWKNHGHVVAMTGDGINDTLAMKKADIGIAMGISGTEITKQIADMVILDDHFATIVTAIKEGRGIYNNIIKFVHFLLSANFAELLVIFFGMLWGFSTETGTVWAILLPSQILWINLITDGCPAIALAFDPIEKTTMLRAPRKLSAPILSISWIMKLILMGTLIAFGSIFAAHLGFKVSKTLGQSMAFTQLVILELGILFILRLPLSFISNRWLMYAITTSILLQLLVIYFPPMRVPFGTTFLNGIDWLQIIIITVLINVFLLLVVKIKKTHE